MPLKLFSAGLAAAVTLGLGATSDALAQPLGGSQLEPGSTLAAIVKVPTPWYAPRALVVSRMRDTFPLYETLPGLSYKAFTLAQADGHFGGIYLWKDPASARNWFNTAWFGRVEKERGVQGQVRFFEVPVALDNAPSTPTGGTNGAVATLVTVPIPQGVNKARLIEEFKAAIPTYRAVPGLLRKYFIITDDGGFGGIYLWQDEASARAWFSPDWQARTSTRYGAPAALEWFDVPLLLPSRVADSTPRIPGL